MLRSRVAVCAFTLVACVAAHPAAAGLKALKGFDKDLEKHGVTESYSGPGLEALRALVRDEIAEAERRSADAKPHDRARLRKIADAARGVLDRPQDPGAASSEFAALRSLLFSLRTEIRGVKGTVLVADIFRLLRNMSLKLPYLTPEERVQPLTPERAAREAPDLVDPRSGAEYAAPAALAGLTPEEVSHLDVRHDDYL